jgi:hypothetical protein
VSDAVQCQILYSVRYCTVSDTVQGQILRRRPTNINDKIREVLQTECGRRNKRNQLNLKYCVNRRVYIRLSKLEQLNCIIEKARDIWKKLKINAKPSFKTLNPLNAELNPICYLLALLGVHHFLHVSRIRVKTLTLRLLRSYIYIHGAPILDDSRSHTTTQHSR